MSVFNPKSSRQKTVIHGKAIPSLFLGLLLVLSFVPSFSQNTLNNAGLSSATPAASAYSLRRLSSTYSGSAIQVRRSSDNTTQNIGFTGNDLDTSSLKTFVGSGDGFITIWYDQSGNARNLTQTTENMQPAIINGGTIFRRNFRPTMYYDNANDGMVFTGAAYLSNNPITVNVVAGSNSNTAAFRRGVQGSANWLIGPYNNQHSWFAGTGFNHQETTPWSTTNIERLTVIQDVRPFSWRNGTEIVIPNMVATNNLGTPGHIYTGTGGSGNEPLDGFISEVICFSSNIGNTARLTLDENQNVYYSALENALHFDGVDDFVNCGTSSLLDIRSSMTVELWIRPTTNMGNGKWDRLVHRNFGTGYFFGGKAGSTNALAVVLNNNINLVATPDNTVTVNEWQHVAFVFDDVANTVKIYRNGIEVASASYTGTIAGGNFNCTLSENSAEAFGGAMDEVRIWNVARTQAQLQANMGAPINAATTGLVVYYNFNQGNPGGTNTGLTTLVDATSSAINGTLSGFALTGTTSNWGTSTIFGTLSNNADLSNLTTTAGTLTPSFAAATTAYTAFVANATTSVTVTPNRAEANATIQVRVNGGIYSSVTSGSTSGDLALNVGSNTIDVTVTAQDGITTKTYTITVTRTPIVPTITSFSPLSAKPGDAVTIQGSNFDGSVATTAVYFGGVQALVTGAGTSTVIARVPYGASHGSITLLNTNTKLMAQSALKFNATYSPPKSSFSTIDLTPRVDISSGSLSYPYDVSMADIDGDGKLDMIVVLRGSSRISIFRNISNTGSLAAASFADKADFFVGTVPYAVAVADLDGDGKQDIAVANASSNNVSILRNISSTGSISLEAAVNFSVGNGPQSIAIGDIDGDGKPEIVTANHSARNIAILRNVATSGTINSSSFLARVNTTLGSNSRPTSVTLADIDIDGKLDIVVANSIESRVAVFRNLASVGTIDGTSLASKVDLATGQSPAFVAAADIDGDGKLDIITANGGGNSISVHRNVSSSGSIAASSFSTHVEIAAGTSPKALALVDMDGDGKVDVALVNKTANTVSIFRNQANSGSISTSSFATSFEIACGAEPFAIAVGDLDNDGRQDIAVANSDEHNISIYKNISNDANLRNLLSSVGNILPTFSAATTSYTLQVANTTSSLAILPVRADSAATMQVRINAGSYSAVTSSVPTQPLSLNVGNNTVEILVTAENGSTKTYTVAVTRLEPAPIVQGFTPMHAKPGDVVTITGSNFNTTAASNIVFFGATRATVTAATATSVTAIVPVGATYAPITVVNNSNSLIAQSVLSFQPIYNVAKTDIGTADFDSRLNFSTIQPSALAVGDLDGDGKSDFVVATDLSSGGISILRNQASTGNILFALPFSLATVSGFGNPNSVAIADLDGDGKLDIAVTHRSSNVISIFRNISTSGSLSSASFATRVDIIATAPSGSITLGDIDGDGKIDMVVVSRSPSLLSIYRNQHTSGNFSTASFAAAVNFTIDSYPESVALGDVDGDGKLDVALNIGGLQNVAVFKNNSIPGTITTSSLASSVSFAVNRNPRFVRFADLDGDQKLDLIVANYESGNISVLRNTATVGTINSSSFAAGINYSAGSLEPRLLSFGDVDGDGKTDMVIARNDDTQIRVVRNIMSSAGLDTQTFETGIELSAGAVPSATMLADLDGDAKPELIFASRIGSNIGVFRNTDIPTWNGTDWQPADPSSTTDAVIASNNAPASFSSRGLIIDTGFALNTTGITATIHGDIVNNGNGIASTGNIIVEANSSIRGNMINFNGTLTVNTGAVFTTNNLLTLTSNATNTAMVANSAGTISGIVTVQRYIPNGRRAFRFLAHPFSSNIPISSLTDNIDITGTGGGTFTSTTTNSPSAFSYINTSANSSINPDPGWTALTAASTLNAKTGYRILVRGSKGQSGSLTGGIYTPDAVTLDWTGTLNQGNQIYTLSRVGANSEYNLIGNPYACPVDLNLVTRGSNINANFSVWDANVSTRGAYITQSFGSSYILPSGAAFFTQTSNGSTNNTITFSESSKSTGSPNTLFSTSATDDRLVLVVNDSIGNYVDKLEFYFNKNEYTQDYDTKWDAQKLLNPVTNFYSISKDGKYLAIDRRDIDYATTIPLVFTNTEVGSFLILTPQTTTNTNWYLKDNYKKTETLLETNKVIKISITNDVNSQGSNRFELVAKANTVVAPDISIDIKEALTVHPIITKDGNIRVSFKASKKMPTSIRVVDINGRILKTINMGYQRHLQEQLQIGSINGTVIIQLQHGKDRFSKKVVSVN